MRKFNKIIPLLLAMVLMCVLTGCSTMSPQQQAEKALEAASGIKNSDFSIGIEMAMSAQGQDVNTNINMNGSYFTDPMKTKMEMSVDMGSLGSQTINMFIAAEGDKVKVYTNNSGEWIAQEMTLDQYSSSMKQADAKANMELFLKNAKNFKATGNEEIGGVKTVKLEGVITGDSIEEVIKESGALSGMDSMFSSLGTDSDVAESMLKDMKDMNVTFWIDSANYYPVKYDIDMTDMIQKIMNNLIESLGTGQSIALTVSKYRMTMELSNINNATDFTLPEVK